MDVMNDCIMQFHAFKIFACPVQDNYIGKNENSWQWKYEIQKTKEIIIWKR